MKTNTIAAEFVKDFGIDYITSTTTLGKTNMDFNDRFLLLYPHILNIYIHTPKSPYLFTYPTNLISRTQYAISCYKMEYEYSIFYSRVILEDS